MNKIISVSNELITTSYSRAIRELNLESVKNNLISSVDENSNNESTKQVIRGIISYTIVPNEVIVEDMTNEAKLAAEKQVIPVMINEGETVALAGELITPEKVELISQSGNTLSSRGTGFTKYILALIAILIPTAIWIIYIYNLHMDVYLSNKFFILMVGNLLTLMVSAIAERFSVSLVPLLALALITAIYVDVRLTIPNSINVIVLLTIFYRITNTEIIYLLTLVVLIAVYGNSFGNKINIFKVSLISAILALHFIPSLGWRLLME